MMNKMSANHDPGFQRNRYFQAASRGDLSEVRNFLHVDKSLLNCVDDSGWTALMRAAYDGWENVVEYLLLSGCDYSLVNKQKRTALNIARRRGHRKVVDLLLAAEDGEFDRDVEGISSQENYDEYQPGMQGISDNFAQENCEFQQETQRTLDFSNENNGEFQQEMQGTSTNFAQENYEESYCSVCSASFRDPNHETSIVHLLKLGSESGQKPSYSIPETNKGYQILLKSGWDVSRGLGRQSQGRWYPVKTTLKRDRLGLGSAKAPKPRVTHFSANDNKAIQEYRRRKIRTEVGKLTKKERVKKDMAEKEWIRNFRREFY